MSRALPGESGGHDAGVWLPGGPERAVVPGGEVGFAGENDYTTGTFQQITGRPPRPVAEFLHTCRAEFL